MVMVSFLSFDGDVLFKPLMCRWCDGAHSMTSSVQHRVDVALDGVLRWSTFNIDLSFEGAARQVGTDGTSSSSIGRGVAYFYCHAHVLRPVRRIHE